MFLVFSGDSKNPKGGWEDLRESFHSEDCAISYAKRLISDEYNSIDWIHIVDLDVDKIIWQW